ncbi:ribonuclease E [bacterium MnTg02]|nr:ribonuclease E [bacterium MnTg02]
MGNKMLIDAAHPEETRVVVLRGNRVEEFDHESAVKKQLRGNIYLAKVTRVEPSLQAAFVDYGGNRHGFLAFSEIHPDYYQIPVADRQALLEEEAEEESRAEAEAAAEDESPSDAEPDASDAKPASDTAEAGIDDESGSKTSDDNVPQPDKPAVAIAAPGDSIADTTPADPDAGSNDDDAAQTSPGDADFSDVPEAHGLVEDLGIEDVQNADGSDTGNGRNEVESVGSEDAMEEVPTRVRKRHRVYNIQEVIKRRQIILVQVVKEERGGKGAALTTYLSLAGRYTVLMPNTARGGGISRKITNPTDRKRLRKIAAELEVPAGTGLIIRTAGASRTKAEIKRDFEYLLRLWENVRDFTLQSTAPALVYEEGNLIKRSIRDLYSREIEEVLVAGDDAYREAKDFMRMLMPSHAKNVQPYKDTEPLFIRHQIERQLNAMFSPYVTLKSGGYIVINQTEALVAVDVNSGKSTREHNIEDTALKTNSEAAEEISRQLRLRDLAGLIVIDFIDMEERRNNRAVERKLKECLRNDRARIQVGRISHFGLLEMSRQRLRTGVLEGSTTQCAYCQGTGVIRSKESVALSVLRALEDTLKSGEVLNLKATASVDAALYILNQKRYHLKDIERRYRILITIAADERIHGANFKIVKSEDEIARPPIESSVVQLESVFEAGDEEEVEADDSDNKTQPRKRRRRRRTRDNADGAEAVASSDAEAPPAAESGETAPVEASAGDGGDEDQTARPRKPRRRGRRGGRRTRSQGVRAASADPGRSQERGAASENSGADAVASDRDGASAPADAAASPAQPQAVETAKTETASDPTEPRAPANGSRRRRSTSRRTDRRPRREPSAEREAGSNAHEPQDEKSNQDAAASSDPRPEPSPAEEPTVVEKTPERAKRGWWQRRLQQG